jgi:monoamine oxidase
MHIRTEVAILGAGAAGLAAATALRRAGTDVVVLEARGRVGGRVRTRWDARCAGPVELGAEFVHGEAAELRPLLDDAGTRVVEVDGERWERRGEQLQPLDDFWGRLQRVFAGFGDLGPRDRSVDAVLATEAPGDDAQARQLARQFVAGFQAADPGRASARALAGDGNAAGSGETRRMGRVIDGFARVLERLADPLGDRVLRATIVHGVRWRRGHVDVDATRRDGRGVRVSAAAAVVAVPLGVLQAPRGAPGRIRFDPPLEAKRLALLHLAPGHVVRLVMTFARPVWLDDDVRRAGERPLTRCAFLHAWEADLPVWWTSHPLRTPTLVGWCGGPAAQHLAEQPGRAVFHAALASLSSVLGLPEERLRVALRGAWSHDWTADPFSRGAYAYQLVGGEEAPARLASPLDDTLFFAGEATAGDGRIGTVDGALASGLRAAGEVRAAAGARRRVAWGDPTVARQPAPTASRR